MPSMPLIEGPLPGNADEFRRNPERRLVGLWLVGADAVQRGVMPEFSIKVPGASRIELTQASAPGIIGELLDQYALQFNDMASGPHDRPWFLREQIGLVQDDEFAYLRRIAAERVGGYVCEAVGQDKRVIVPAAFPPFSSRRRERFGANQRKVASKLFRGIHLVQAGTIEPVAKATPLDAQAHLDVFYAEQGYIPEATLHNRPSSVKILSILKSAD